jgi:alkanesulfonate monooxygenase SsuD/methylene tetrahydromethanopterin reductase-like flavin-dependent oxidoreductase (luciferase family)
MKSWKNDPRSGTNPIFNDNRVKLGTFGTNGGGVAMTKVREAAEVSWSGVINAALLADRAGIEALVPFARWKGYVEAKPNHRTGVAFDCYTWEAGQGQATRNVSVFTTSHVPTIHPVLAAKQCATIDNITGGRFGLNVVAGWNQPELEMFGAPMREHDDRYDQAAEWLEVLKRLWTCDEAFDFEGHYYRLSRAISLPHPIQRPFPPIMNAGGSKKGQHFAARHADMAFIIIQRDDPESCREQIDSYRELARREYDREIQFWSYGYVVQADTRKEAEGYLHYYVIENGDEEAVDGWTKLQGLNTEIAPPDVLRELRNRFKAGAGGFPLVGTPDDITARLELLSKSGLDGILLSWVDYEDGLRKFCAEVMPRLEQAGLRKRFMPKDDVPAGHAD